MTGHDLRVNRVTRGDNIGQILISGHRNSQFLITLNQTVLACTSLTLFIWIILGPIFSYFRCLTWNFGNCHHINPILCHQRFSSPIFCANHCHLDRNIATSPESWWQFSFEPSADLNKVFFHDLIQKTSKIWILKTLVRIFTHFQAFFINPWSRGKHSWLWIGRSGFKSRSQTKNFQNIF